MNEAAILLEQWVYQPLPGPPVIETSERFAELEAIIPGAFRTTTSPR